MNEGRWRIYTRLLSTHHCDGEYNDSRYLNRKIWCLLLCLDRSVLRLYFPPILIDKNPFSPLSLYFQCLNWHLRVKFLAPPLSQWWQVDTRAELSLRYVENFRTRTVWGSLSLSHAPILLCPLIPADNCNHLFWFFLWSSLNFMEDVVDDETFYIYSYPWLI